jgi:hypothetical protein
MNIFSFSVNSLLHFLKKSHWLIGVVGDWYANPTVDKSLQFHQYRINVKPATVEPGSAAILSYPSFT